MVEYLNDNGSGNDPLATVPFCCTTTIPASFELQDPSLGNPRIIFDVCGLSCSVVSCIAAGTLECNGNEIVVEDIEGFAPVLNGCIQFLVSTFPVTGPCGNEEFGGVSAVALSCQGTICLEEVIGDFTTDEAQAEAFCEELFNALESGDICDVIEATNLEVNEVDCNGVSCPNERVIQFTGEFVINSLNG